MDEKDIEIDAPLSWSIVKDEKSREKEIGVKKGEKDKRTKEQREKDLYNEAYARITGRI